MNSVAYARLIMKSFFQWMKAMCRERILTRIWNISLKIFSLIFRRPPPCPPSTFRTSPKGSSGRPLFPTFRGIFLLCAQCAARRPLSPATEGGRESFRPQHRPSDHRNARHLGVPGMGGRQPAGGLQALRRREVRALRGRHLDRQNETAALDPLQSFDAGLVALCAIVPRRRFP